MWLLRAIFSIEVHGHNRMRFKGKVTHGCLISVYSARDGRKKQGFARVISYKRHNTTVIE